MTIRTAYRPMPAAVGRQLGVFIPGEAEALRDELFAADAYLIEQRGLLRTVLTAIKHGETFPHWGQWAVLTDAMYYYGAAQYRVKQAEAALADYAHRHHL